MSAALARALAAQAAAVVQTTAFRRRALQVAVQSAAKRFRRGLIPRQLNLPALAGKSLSLVIMFKGLGVRYAAELVKTTKDLKQNAS